MNKLIGLLVLVSVQLFALSNVSNYLILLIHTYVYFRYNSYLIKFVIFQAQSYEDKRCKCICPSINSVMNNTQEDNNRILVIENVAPNKW